MKWGIIFSPGARHDFHALSAYDRAKVRDAIDEHLAHSPTKESKSRIKRLRELKKPQYRLRIEKLRVFYDVENGHVIVLGIVKKPNAEQWLQGRGERR